MASSLTYITEIQSCEKHSVLKHRRNMVKSTLILLPVLLLVLNSSKHLHATNINNNEIEGDDRDQTWVSIKSIRNKVEVAEGDLVELECEASGTPQPQIHFDEEATDLDHLSMSPHHLLLHSTTALVSTVARLRFIPKRSQVIYCKAFAGGKTDQAAIKIIVTKSKLSFLNNEILQYSDMDGVAKYQSPRITFFDTMYLDEIGNNVVLPCRSSGNGKVGKVWLNENQEVLNTNNDKRLTVTPMGDLIIENVQWSDLGLYTCLAKNSYGEDSISTFLYPMVIFSYAFPTLMISIKCMF